MQDHPANPLTPPSYTTSLSGQFAGAFGVNDTSNGDSDMKFCKDGGKAHEWQNPHLGTGNVPVTIRWTCAYCKIHTLKWITWPGPYTVR